MILLTIFKNGLRQRLLKSTVSIVSLAFSIALLLVIAHIHEAVRGYAKYVSSETDLIVASATHPVPLVLYGLFGVGAPPPRLDYRHYQFIHNHPHVELTTPMATDLSHRGFAVVATLSNYFSALNLTVQQFTESKQPVRFRNNRSAFIGTDAAEALGYHPGVTFEVAGESFVLQGVLQPVGSTLDDSIFVPVNGFIHSDSSAEALPLNLLLVKLKDEALTEQIKAQLQAADPSCSVVTPEEHLERLGGYGYTLKMMFMVMSMMMGGLSLLMMFFSITTGFAARQHELQLLHMVGAKPWKLAVIGFMEPLLHLLLALLLGVIFYQFAIYHFQQQLPVLQQVVLDASHLTWLGGLIVAGFIVAIIPAWKVYGLSSIETE